VNKNGGNDMVSKVENKIPDTYFFKLGSMVLDHSDPQFLIF